MITDVYIVFNDDSQKERIIKSELKISPFFHFLDERNKNTKKEIYRLKGSFAAKQTPFAVVYEEMNKPIRAFYSESNEDVINQLIKFLNS